MSCRPDIVEMRPFTLDQSVGEWAAGVIVTVPGQFNVLLRVTAEISVPDLRFGFGPVPLLDGQLCGPGRWLQVFLPFAMSQADHRFIASGTAPAAGAICFTFGRIPGLPC